MSKYLDNNGLLYFWQKLKAALGTKVDAVAGKGLSTNDYTTAEKTKLAGISAGANAYTHPAYTARTSALYKVTVDSQGHVSAATAAAKADITALGIPGQDTTYSAATTSAAGLMAAADKTKLDGISAGANAYAHPTGDGNRHVPATGTGNNGKFLRAGSTAASEAWGALAKADVTGALGYTPPTPAELSAELEELWEETRIVPNYEYGGRNLQEVFGTAAALHAAVAAGDFSRVRVGDYWPVTLTGSFYDYADSTTRTLSNAVLKMEVAGIDTYYKYGDTPVPHHLLLCSRDCLPIPLKMRSASGTWYYGVIPNPWRGSTLFETLNNPTNGLLSLLSATVLGSYLYGGPSGAGMDFLGEYKPSAQNYASNWLWLGRGKIFLPTEREVYGQDAWSEYPFGGAGLMVQWPIFPGGYRPIKGLGDGGSRNSWWFASSNASSLYNFCKIDYTGNASYGDASNAYGVPVCFLLA